MPATATSLAPTSSAASQFSEAERNALILHYHPIIYTMARAYLRRFRNLADTADLVNDGILAFISALDHFDPSLGKPLWAYASSWVMGAFRTYYRSQTTKTYRETRTMTLITATTRRLQSQLIRQPTHQELATELGLSLSAFYALWDQLLPYESCSFERFEPNADRLDSEHADFAPSHPGPTPFATTLQHELRAKITKTIKSLDQQHQDIFRLHYEQQLSARAIAKRLSISARTVERLLQESVTQLTAAINPSRAARRVSARRAQAVPATACYSAPALAYSFC